jgi:hypothetical protein
LIADVGGWTGTLIGIRYALYVEKIELKPIPTEGLFVQSFETSYSLLHRKVEPKPNICFSISNEWVSIIKLTKD